MSKVPCLTCGWPTDNTSRCQPCQKKHNTGAGAKPSSTQRGYDSTWNKLRKQILDRDQWTCFNCHKQLIGKDATVDHIVPFRLAPQLRLDPANLRAACHACNSGKRGR